MNQMEKEMRGFFSDLDIENKVFIGNVMVGKRSDCVIKIEMAASRVQDTYNIMRVDVNNMQAGITVNTIFTIDALCGNEAAGYDIHKIYWNRDPYQEKESEWRWECDDVGDNKDSRKDKVAIVKDIKKKTCRSLDRYLGVFF